MVTEEIIHFIKEQQEKGMTDADIHAMLIKSNWSEQDLQQAFDHAKSGIPVPPQATNSTNSESTMRLILTIVALLFMFPLGVIFMWMWMKWPKWVKLAVTIVPVVLWVAYVAFLFFVLFTLGSSKTQLNNQTPLRTTTGAPSVSTAPPPPGNFGSVYSQADNTKRRSDVNSILNAIEQYNG